MGVFARRLGLLRPGAFPSLRLSLVLRRAAAGGGRATAWAAAAPGSVVENLYGPTEATIACTAYTWDPQSGARPRRWYGCPIGAPLPGMRALVAGDDLLEVPPEARASCGRAAGQRRVLARSRADGRPFVVPPGRREVHYRTGDRARRPVGDGPLCFLGRRDHQIKVLGHRVELGEVEAALRDASGVDAVVAVGWPRTATGATGIVGFIGDTTVDGDRVLELVRGRLPSYMVPRELRVLAEIPLNANGKMDRGALLRSLEEPRVPAVG